MSPIITSLASIIKQFGIGAVISSATPSGLTATGGVISDYTDGSSVYRAHIFTSSGTFDVSAIGDYPADVEYLVVAGGGGGGKSAGGGGGAGGGAGGATGAQAGGTGGAIGQSGTNGASNYNTGNQVVTGGAGGGGRILPGNGGRGGFGQFFESFGAADIGLISSFINASYAGYEVDAARWPLLASFIQRVKSHPAISPLLTTEAQMLGLAQ